MNEKLERLLDEVAHEIEKIHEPDLHTSISIRGNYRSITIIKWGPCEGPVEQQKRREIYDSWHYEGTPWEPNGSEGQNEYLRRIGCLLETEG